MTLKLSLLTLLASVVVMPVSAQPISTKAVQGNVYMLTGQGGNIGVMIGDDGTFMIDD